MQPRIFLVTVPEDILNIGRPEIFPPRSLSCFSRHANDNGRFSFPMLDMVCRLYALRRIAFCLDFLSWDAFEKRQNIFKEIQNMVRITNQSDLEIIRPLAHLIIPEPFENFHSLYCQPQPQTIDHFLHRSNPFISPVMACLLDMMGNLP